MKSISLIHERLNYWRFEGKQGTTNLLKKFRYPRFSRVETFCRDLPFIFRRFKPIRRFIQTFLFPFLKNSFSLGNENWKVSRNWISWLFTKGLKNSLKCRGRQSSLSRVSFHRGHESFWSNLMVLVIFWHILTKPIRYGDDKLMISLKENWFLLVLSILI